jgi:hypothetical protein
MSMMNDDYSAAPEEESDDEDYEYDYSDEDPEDAIMSPPDWEEADDPMEVKPVIDNNTREIRRRSDNNPNAAPVAGGSGGLILSHALAGISKGTPFC